MPLVRIVAGSAGGRRIAVPAGAGTRPTSDRAREAMFSTLAGLVDLDGARVLDLYAGSGALGLEALSRGAAAAVFVESDPGAARTIKANAAALGLRADVRRESVQRFTGGDVGAAPYRLVLADPPYELPAEVLGGQLDSLAPHLEPGAILVVERSARDADWVWPAPYEALRVRRYGSGALWYGRRP